MPDGPEQEARDEIFLSQLETGLTGNPFPSRWQGGNFNLPRFPGLILSIGPALKFNPGYTATMHMRKPKRHGSQVPMPKYYRSQTFP